MKMKSPETSLSIVSGQFSNTIDHTYKSIKYNLKD